MSAETQVTDHSAKAFENAIRAILTAFGVFAGVAIKSVVDGIKISEAPSWSAILDSFADPHLFVALAAIALLLRYIIGSAVHLNLCYVTDPRSTSRVMLFKDLAFLIAFGLIAIFTIKAKDVTSFEIRAAIFIIVGLLWSVTDWLIRNKTNWLGGGTGEKSLFSGWWVTIDLCQLVLTYLASCLSRDNWRQSLLIAIIFSAALLADMIVVLNAKKPAV
jgi:hypothetical protein